MIFLLAASSFAQTTIVGGDWGNADLVPADGDILEGVFTNVATLTIPYGTTVLVQHQVPLEIHAKNITIDGALDGTGAGGAGGQGAPTGGVVNGDNGVGPGRGTGGLPGPCVHGGGGGGGGYGGVGGNGSYYFSNGQGMGGPVYGDDYSRDVEMGSGGGGSGSGCDFPGGNGGGGGAAITLYAGVLEVNGLLSANGRKGVDGVEYSGAGGGGSGGTVLVDVGICQGDGLISATGGDGGDAVVGLGGLAGGGGGGGGGRIKIFYGVLEPTVLTSMDPGRKGDDQSTGYARPGSAGRPGTLYTELTDPDIDDDNIDVPYDNCPNDPNPDQADRDDDGIGDACDSCPDDPVDSDGDGVCESVDICPGSDDHLDFDLDGQPDGCDCAPKDEHAQTGAIEACDHYDNDCNGVIDDPGAQGEVDFYADLDGDGFGDPTLIRHECFATLNFVADGTDCNDTRPDAFPGDDEICDGIDNDCDGVVDPHCGGDNPDSAGGPQPCGCSDASVAPLWLGLLIPLVARRRRP